MNMVVATDYLDYLQIELINFTRNVQLETCV